MKYIATSLIGATIMLAADANVPKDKPASAQSETQVASGTKIVYVTEIMSPVTIRMAFQKEVAFTAPRGEQFVEGLLGAPDRFPHTRASLPSRVYAISPAFSGNETTLHLITDHGNVYPFILQSGKFSDPDVTVYLRSNDDDVNQRIASHPTVVPYDQWQTEQSENERLRKQLEATTVSAEKKTEKEVADFKRSYPAQWTSYDFNRKEAAGYPWSIEEISHDDKFVYIRRAKGSQDLPTVYGIEANKKPEMIIPQYDPDRDVYVITRLLHEGYLSFGHEKREKKLLFKMRG